MSHVDKRYRKPRQITLPVLGFFRGLFRAFIRAGVADVSCVRGLLSDVQSESVEAIALDQNVAPRTLQRFLESIVWDKAKLRDRCQQLVATEHARLGAIGCIDESETAKSGNHTVGIKRHYNGNRAKIENCVNNVAISYTAPSFACMLDAQIYLPEDWTEDPERQKSYVPNEITFQTKPQIALVLQFGERLVNVEER